jgi:hypothetical protein
MMQLSEDMAGWLESFEVMPTGDVLLSVTVPSEGIYETIKLSHVQLAGMAEASAVAAETYQGRHRND